MTLTALCKSSWGHSGETCEESTCQCRRHRFGPWVGNIPCRRKWQSIPVFLPGKFHGQRKFAVYSVWDCKELDMTEQLNISPLSRELTFLGKFLSLHMSYIPKFTRTFHIPFFKIFIFLMFFKIYLTVPDLSCSMRNLVPWKMVEPGTSSLGTWSLIHWTTRKVLTIPFCKWHLSVFWILPIDSYSTQLCIFLHFTFCTISPHMNTPCPV